MRGRARVPTLHQVVQVCFNHSPFRRYEFAGLFEPWALHQIMYGWIDDAKFHGLGLVEARDLGCDKVGRSVNEILCSLYCMMWGDSYCTCDHQFLDCGGSFARICFNDPTR
jgi:hypothetical protein